MQLRLTKERRENMFSIYQELGKFEGTATGHFMKWPHSLQHTVMRKILPNAAVNVKESLFCVSSKRRREWHTEAIEMSLNVRWKFKFARSQLPPSRTVV